MTKELIESLREILSPEQILENEPMAAHCSFRIGGPADLFLKVRTEEELSGALARIHDEGADCFLLGRGTNLLIGDGGYRGVVITMTDSGKTGESRPAFSEGRLSGVRVEGNRVRAGAGASMLETAVAARDAGLTGLEFAAGIPGSIGGGIVMNAGAYGGEMKQVVRSVRLMTPDGQMHVYPLEKMEFGYRTSILKKINAFVTGAEFELESGDPEQITKAMAELGRKRKEKQPLELPSAGSTFKRPEGYFAGKLIMDAGLKGYTVGGAQVSEKHAGFVVNRGGATAADVRKLIEDVQARVFEQAGVRLEREVIYLGEF